MSKVTEEVEALDRLRAREREVAELWRSGTDRGPYVMHEFLTVRSMDQRHFARALRAAAYEAERMMCGDGRQRRGEALDALHQRGEPWICIATAALEALCCKLALLTPSQALIRAAHERRMKSGPTDEQLAARWGAAWEIPR